MDAMTRYNEAGIVLRWPHQWLRAQKTAHPDDPRLKNLPAAAVDGPRTSYFEFFEALTANIHHFYSEKEAENGDL